MEEKRYGTFEEFWPFYVREHQKKSTRIMHFVGTTAAVATFATGLLLRKRWMMIVAPVLGYGPAWISHFFIEKNRPATFKYPLWSLKADFVMWKKIVTGQMDAEVERCLREHAEAVAKADEAKKAAAQNAQNAQNGQNGQHEEQAGTPEVAHAGERIPSGSVN
jgi:hypothetical protein